ncbi:hypothetical protein [Nonomuraea candida]|uniref:hypothetical protein n=1 Tax=Nonomuraea candida TaxID=359159 RepID=UPI0005BAC5BE|nr:hypothetical protein [Nonomuraea candida]
MNARHPLRARWARTRSWRQRLREDGPSRRVLGWVAVAGLAVAAWTLYQGYAGQGEFSVLKLSAGQSRTIETVKRDKNAGKSSPSKEEATVLSLYLANNTDDLKVFREIKVRTKRFVELTPCVHGVGGPVEITEGYDVDLPAHGKSTQTPILYKLEPRQAEGMAITLGSRVATRGVYELEVFLHDGADYRSMGTVTALSDPAVKQMYPLDLDTLPLSDFPDPACLRELERGLTGFIAGADAAPPEVRALRDGVRATAEQLR